MGSGNLWQYCEVMLIQITFIVSEECTREMSEFVRYADITVKTMCEREFITNCDLNQVLSQCVAQLHKWLLQKV